MAKLHKPITIEEWTKPTFRCPLLEVDNEAIERELSLLALSGWVDKEGQFHRLPQRFFDDQKRRFRAEIQRATTGHWLPLKEIVAGWDEYLDDDNDDFEYTDMGDEFTDHLSDELIQAEDTAHFFAIMEGNLSCARQPILGTWKSLDTFFKRYPNGVVIPITIKDCKIGDELFRDHFVGNSSIPTWKQAENNPFHVIDFIKSALDLVLSWLGLEAEYIHTHALTRVNSALFITGRILDVPKEQLPFSNWHRQWILRGEKPEVPQALVDFLEWYANRTEDLVAFLDTSPGFESKLATYFTLCRIQWEMMKISRDHWSGINAHIRDRRRIQAMYINGVLALHVVDMFVALIARYGLDNGLLSYSRDLDKVLADALFEHKAFARAVKPILEHIPGVQNELEQEIQLTFSSLDSTFEAWGYLLAREIATLMKNGSVTTWGDMEAEILRRKNMPLMELMLLNFPDETHLKAILNIVSEHRKESIFDASGAPTSMVIAKLMAQVRKRGLRAHRNTIHGYHLRDMNLQVIRLGRGFVDPSIVLHPMLIWLALIADPKRFVECGPQLLAS